jgi:hypothetical protein
MSIAFFRLPNAAAATLTVFPISVEDGKPWRKGGKRNMSPLYLPLSFFQAAREAFHAAMTGQVE